jgi:beta-glucosidase
MQGRTYRYFKGEPLYPFGYGLSYTKFTYDGLKLAGRTIKAGQPVKVSATVQNSGSRAGDEVVELYVSALAPSVPAPIRSLAGVKRIFLRPGEKQTVSFTLDPAQMSVVTERGKRIMEPGEFLISIGGKQPGFTGRADAPTTSVVQTRFRVEGKAPAESKN